MFPVPFNFGNAVSHYSKTGGPGGFLWKFALAYAALSLVVQAVSVWLQWPVYEVYLRMFMEGSGDIDAYADDLNRVSLRSTIAGLLIMPLSVLLWIVFEGANQRRYMRAERFRLRIGADEGWLFLVGLIWMALFFAMYIGFAIAILIPVGVGFAVGADGMWVAVLLGMVMAIGYMLLALWISARLSAAAALTVRDRRFRFFESWRVTRGKGWTIVGAWVVLMLIMFLALILFYTLAAVLGFSILATRVPDLMNAPEGAVMSAIASPVFWLPMLLIGLIYTCAGAAFMHVLSGPAALAARTDPAWSSTDISTEFQ